MWAVQQCHEFGKSVSSSVFWTVFSWWTQFLKENLDIGKNFVWAEIWAAVGPKFELKLVYFCLWHLLPGIINSSGSGSFLHYRSSQDSSPLSCLKLILLIPNPEYRVFLVFLQSQSSFQLFGMYQQRLTNTWWWCRIYKPWRYLGTDEISGGSPGRNSLIFVWSSKRISREKLNAFILNIFIPAVKQKLRQG